MEQSCLGVVDKAAAMLLLTLEGPMKAVVPWILALLAVAQTMALIRSQRPPGPADANLASLAVGAEVSIPDISVHGSDATVLMAFRSDCVFSQQIASAWSEWMSRERPGVRIVAVSPDAEDVARPFAAANGWVAEIISLEAGDLMSTPTRLVSRTPWVWVLDDASVLRYQGHGGDLAALDGALAGLAEGGS